MQEHFTSIKIATKSCENVAKFKYLRKTPTHKNFMHQEVKVKVKVKVKHSRDRPCRPRGV
jgi:hypothetical protein